MTRVAVYMLSATAIAAVLATSSLVMAKGGPGGRDAMFDGMFEQFDGNADGAITKDEIEAVRAARFDASDTNGDGQLSVEEMQAAAAARAADRVNRRIEARVDRFDANDDGLLSLAELTSEGSRMDRIFDRVDADDDGRVTKEEAEAMQARRFERRNKAD